MTTPEVATLPPSASTAEPALSVVRVTQRFQALQVLRGVTFDVHSGEVLGIIGPNGAGKTTLMRIMAGEQRPRSGSVLLRGNELVGHRPDDVRRRGLAFTHQIEAAFHSMTVLENALLGALFGGRSRPGFNTAVKFAAECLSTVGLVDRADTIVGNLNVADRKRLELARALAGSPSVLLLDELFAGTSIEIVTSLAQTVRRVAAMGVAVVVVEHLMGVVTALCDRVLVLVEGELIAEGKPDVVLRDERVIAAYLGTSDARY